MESIQSAIQPLSRCCFGLIVVLLLLSTGASLSAQTEGGTLIREIRTLRDDVDRSRQGVEALQSHPQIGTGRERARNLDAKLAAGDLEGAAEAFQRDLAEGFGAGFHRKIREQAEAERDRNLDLFQRIVEQRARHAALRGDRAAGAAGDPLQEIGAHLQRSRATGSFGEVEKLLGAIEESAEMNRIFLERFPETALEFFGDAGDVPPEFLEGMALAALHSFAQANTAAERSRRAEAFYQSFPQILRRRSEERESGQTMIEAIRADAREMF